MKLTPSHAARTRPALRRRGTQLIECVVYIGVLLVVLNASGAALFRVLEHLRAVRHQAQHVAAVLTVGERWRAEVRQAVRGVEWRSIGEETLLSLNADDAQIDYLRRGDALFRRGGALAPWVPVLRGIREARFLGEDRDGVAAWRWEVTLAPRPGDRRPPLCFTFQAVPAKGIPLP